MSVSKKTKQLFLLIITVIIILFNFFSGNEPVENVDLNVVSSTVEQIEELASSSVEVAGDKIIDSDEVEILETDSEGRDLFLVTKVVDGDTVEVEIDGKLEKLRLIGVDTPETVDPRKKVQCYGKEASEFTKATLLGKSVRLERDQSQDERDKYGRMLVYLWLDDSLFNERLIAEGYAHEYTYQKPYYYQERFKTAQNLARENLLGLWSPETCSGVKK